MFTILQGPLTQNVKHALARAILDSNADLISLKVSTTTPKVRHFRF